jgi:uncharacterized protein
MGPRSGWDRVPGCNRREFLGGAAAIGLVRTAGMGEWFPMEQRISIVTLGVRNLETAKKFYVEGLGWKPVFENREIVFFEASGMVFALFLRDQLAADFGADPASFGRSAMALAYNVREKREVDPLLRQAHAAGAEILQPARDAVWGGYSGYFADPDGFAWEVAWNPGWRLAPDGSIHIPTE